jgi:hypothetical protein
VSGKGSKSRPFSVDRQTFESNWDNIFKKKETTNESDSLEQEPMSVLRTSEESSKDERY